MMFNKSELIRLLIEKGLKFTSSCLSVIETLMENCYDLNISKQVNLVCEKCSAISDLDFSCSIEARDIMRKSGFLVTDVRMEYYGYCRNCQEET